MKTPAAHAARLAGLLAETRSLERVLGAAFAALVAADASTHPARLTQAVQTARLAAEDLIRALDHLFAAGAEADAAVSDAGGSASNVPIQRKL